MSSIHQVRPKPTCKAQWKEEENKADRRRGGKTPSAHLNGQAWSLPSPREQWKTEKKWRKLVVKSSVVLQRPSQLRDRWRWKWRFNEFYFALIWPRCLLDVMRYLSIKNSARVLRLSERTNEIAYRVATPIATDKIRPSRRTESDSGSELLWMSGSLKSIYDSGSHNLASVVQVSSSGRSCKAALLSGSHNSLWVSIWKMQSSREYDNNNEILIKRELLAYTRSRCAVQKNKKYLLG